LPQIRHTKSAKLIAIEEDAWARKRNAGAFMVEPKPENGQEKFHKPEGQAGQLSPEKAQKLQELKQGLVKAQLAETERLKGGGKSGITNEFGKPAFYDSAAGQGENALKAPAKRGADNLIAQASEVRTPAATRDIQDHQALQDLCGAGQSIKFTVQGTTLNFQPEGNWTAQQWATQHGKLVKYLQAHPDEFNRLSTEAKQNGSVEIKSKILSGEVADEVNVADKLKGVVHEGHAIRVTTNGKGIQWAPEGNWDAKEWAQQQRALNDYFNKHPGAVNKLMAEAQQNGGSIEVKHPTITGQISDDEHPDRLPHEGGAKMSDKNQYLSGSGWVEGRQVSVGLHSSDTKIPANAPDGYYVSVRTTDGTQQVNGHIVTRGQQKYFYPDEIQDASGRRTKVDNGEQNLVKLNKSGPLTYE